VLDLGALCHCQIITGAPATGRAGGKNRRSAPAVSCRGHCGVLTALHQRDVTAIGFRRRSERGERDKDGRCRAVV
jgi:hypothetical protein